MADEQQLIDDGETLLNDDGSTAVDPACCCVDVEPCPHCNEGLTPNSVTLTLTELPTTCDEEEDEYADFAALLDLPVVLPGFDWWPCHWYKEFDIGDVTWVYHFKILNATTWRVLIHHWFGLLSYGIFYYEGTFDTGECNTVDEVVENVLTEEDCGTQSVPRPYEFSEHAAFGGFCAVDST